MMVNAVAFIYGSCLQQFWTAVSFCGVFGRAFWWIFCSKMRWALLGAPLGSHWPSNQASFLSYQHQSKRDTLHPHYRCIVRGDRNRVVIWFPKYQERRELECKIAKDAWNKWHSLSLTPPYRRIFAEHKRHHNASLAKEWHLNYYHTYYISKETGNWLPWYLFETSCCAFPCSLTILQHSPSNQQWIHHLLHSTALPMIHHHLLPHWIEDNFFKAWHPLPWP